MQSTFVNILHWEMILKPERENEEKLLSFYRDNRFSQLDTRKTTSDTDESQFVESKSGWGKHCLKKGVAVHSNNMHTKRAKRARFGATVSDFDAKSASKSLAE